MQFSTCAIYKLKDGSYVCALEKANGDSVLYSKEQFGYLGGTASIKNYNDDLTHKFDYDFTVMAYKRFDSQSEALDIMLKDDTYICWDWERGRC